MNPTAQLSGAGFALDPAGLEQLKRKSREAGTEAGQGKALRQAAGQFEAVFMNLLLKSMRESLPKDGMMESDTTRTFTGMYDAQIAQKMSEKGVGLADMIVRQVEARSGAQPSLPRAEGASTLGKIKSLTVEAARDDRSPKAGAPREFVQRMWDSARSAEQSTGMPAQFILGQAALESGWGRREIRNPDGSSSHNLFGIKAGANWKGPTVDAVTTEYTGGVPRKVTEKFRAYASYAESFADYAKLITNNPRYAGTLTAGADAGRFARSLQNAGYATDPNYAAKLTRVIEQTVRATA
jgi:flagellar protein FlgJ